ncbi:MAG TPA: phosphatase PAP2 family protein, partial [Cellulomonas sp.]|nr:phosphatase PAP2 family protein [Cellulomonas sp.]
MTADQGTVEKQRPRAMNRASSVLLAREATIMVAVYVIYSIIRNHAPNRVVAANHHARDILNVEKALGLDIEHGINHFFAQHTAAITVGNYMYATLFLPSAIFVLAWLWKRAPAQYLVHRSVLVVMTMIALVSYWVFPAAPPRLLPGGGYIDTVVAFETWGRSAADSGHGVSNEYAA